MSGGLVTPDDMVFILRSDVCMHVVFGIYCNYLNLQSLKEAMMPLIQVHPADMDVETANQYQHILKSAKEAFLKDSIGYRVMVKPKLYDENGKRKDVFVLSIWLCDDTAPDGQKVHLAKTAFYEALTRYTSQDVSRAHNEGLYIRASLWEGKFYENSRALSLLIQGLVYVN